MTSGTPSPKLSESVADTLRREYQHALELVGRDGQTTFLESLPTSIRSDIKALGAKRHNGRGVVITLAACKCANRKQDIRAHKAEHNGGFNARSIDTDVVVPMLREWGLANAGESHWLTQVFSGDAFAIGQMLRTQPKIVGELVPRLVCNLNDASPAEIAQGLRALLVLLIEERNKGQIPLTKPKGLTIDRALSLLESHFSGSFKTGGPRLPQLAIYSIYEQLIKELDRYDNTLSFQSSV